MSAESRWDRPCELCEERASVFAEGDHGYCRAHWDELWAWRTAELKAATEAAGGPFPQTCPRRAETGQVADGEDRWEYGHGLVSGDTERLLTCSYCGSVHPDTFMEKVREGWVVGPTDKSYKAYLAMPLNEVGERRRQEALAWDGPVGRDVGKFYYQHLSPEQRTEFIRLYNDKTMKIGYPGRFYSPPFFCRPAAEGAHGVG